MNLSDITPIILTYNEQPNIVRCLASLGWAETILVVDSYSTDDTLSILSRNPKVHVEQRKFDSFAGQWNFAIASKKIMTPWVLAMDADYFVPQVLAEELRNLDPSPDASSVVIRFTYCIYGKPLAGSLYPPLPALFKKEGALFSADGHTMRLKSAAGSAMTVRNRMLHDDRKSVSRWLSSQSDYMNRELEKISKKPPTEWTWREKARMHSRVTPFLVFFYTLFFKRTIFAGWAGWNYSYQRLVAELIFQLKLVETKHNATASAGDSRPQTSVRSVGTL